MADLSVNIAGIKMKNPVMPASGTFGYGQEYAEYFDLSQLGAIVPKSITLHPRKGNPPPRIMEIENGMINSIGLQNEGVDYFIKNHLPYLKKLKTKLIVNIAGETAEEYAQIVAKLAPEKGIDGIEVNISCPNVAKGGMTFGVDPQATAKVIAAVKKETELPIIAKLTPNVTDIKVIAKSAEDAGADALSLINTILDEVQFPAHIVKRTGVKSLKGGKSGPAIRAIALKMIGEVKKTAKIPLIGMGGIMNTSDALTFLRAGADAIAIGTANFINPYVTIEIIEGIKKYLKQNKRRSIKDLRV